MTVQLTDHERLANVFLASLAAWVQPIALVPVLPKLRYFLFFSATAAAFRPHAEDALSRLLKIGRGRIVYWLADEASFTPKAPARLVPLGRESNDHIRVHISRPMGHDSSIKRWWPLYGPD